MSQRLTLGMATHDDFHGVYFTIQAALLYHAKIVGEIVVIDNNPDSEHGKMTKDVCLKLGGKNVKYMPLVGVKGTSITRNQVFKVATNDIVVCCDSHVLFPSGSLAAVLDYFVQRPESLDLIQGPMIYDGHTQVSTHFDLTTWRDQMWGTWATDQRWEIGEPFEIPAQGLGAFATRKRGWLGFSEACRGFGGEEGYIHEKYRKAGRKCWCVPKFTWLHRFGRPEGVSYPLKRADKIRNAVITWKELGKDLTPIYDHFVRGINIDGEGKAPRPVVTEAHWEYYAKGEYPPEEIAAATSTKTVVTKAAEKPGCGNCNQDLAEKSLDEWYEQAAKNASDINEHVPTLKSLAEGCHTVVEFGVRTGVSTAGLLAGRPKQLFSYDLNASAHVKALAASTPQGTKFEFIVGNSLEVDIPECDLLFIDTKHTGDHVYAELVRHASKVRGRIAFHDTEIFGENGDGGGPGLLAGIRKFIDENPDWATVRHDRNNHGFTVISRLPEEQPPKLPPVWRMAITYAKSETRDVLQGRKRVSLEVAEARHSICKSNGGRCPVGMHLIDLDRCAKCGCHLLNEPGQPADSKSGKVWRPRDFCPLGLWGMAPAEGEENGPVETVASE